MLNNVCFNENGGLIKSNLGPAVEGNVMFGGGSLHSEGGVVVDPNTNTHYSDQLDPGYPGWAGNWRIDAPDAANMFELTADAIVRDAGSANPLYNDLDGSRNDAGASGGAWYDPEGWTTDKPVVVGFDLTPELLLEGVNGEVTIKNGKSVSAP